LNKTWRTKCVTSVFTVFFEDPFWVGVLEENYNENIYMGKHIFGAEPSNSELLQFYIYEFDKIKKIKIGESEVKTKKMSFKKSLTKSKKTQNRVNIGTKSQNLFKKALEETLKIKKKERKIKEITVKKEIYIKKREKKSERKKGH